MNAIRQALLTVLFTTTVASAAKAQVAETKADRDARMAWWREARFGMFIHWGVYSVPAGVYQGKPVPGLGEWIMNEGSIPAAEYADYARQFDPTDFNADAIANAAKSAGMKYIVITAKHHDGFAMFHSAASPYNIVDATPFKRDVIKELATAARKVGLRFGVYYSQSQDWHHPGGYAYGRGGRKNGQHWDPSQEGDFDTYLNSIAIPQVKELLESIQPDVLWWDTPGQITLAQATRLHDLLAPYPEIITNNRLISPKLPGAFQGDTETPEQNIPATGFPGGRDWETCMTMNDTWGFKSTDTHFKSTQVLLRNLIDIASKGGNYLLNVGPTSKGVIPKEELDRLDEMGRWLAVNGEAIYGSTPNPFPARMPTPPAPPPAGVAATRPATKPVRPPVVWDWRATTKPGKIYIHLFQWPESHTFTPPLVNGKIARAYLLADPAHSPLPVSSNKPGQYTLTLPTQAPDAIATVICIEIEPSP